MKSISFTFALACLLVCAPALPALAGAPTGFRLPVDNQGVSGAFWVAPPTAGHYTCPMDPDVHADAPGVCPKCNMDLALSPTRVRLVVGGVYAGRTLKLSVLGKHSFSEHVQLDAKGSAETTFKLPQGGYILTAELVAPGSGAHVKLSAPYQLR